MNERWAFPKLIHVVGSIVTRFGHGASKLQIRISCGAKNNRLAAVILCPQD